MVCGSFRGGTPNKHFPVCERRSHVSGSTRGLYNMKCEFAKSKLSRNTKQTCIISCWLWAGQHDNSNFPHDAKRILWLCFKTTLTHLQTIICSFMSMKTKLTLKLNENSGVLDCRKVLSYARRRYWESRTRRARLPPVWASSPKVCRCLRLRKRSIHSNGEKSGLGVIHTLSGERYKTTCLCLQDKQHIHIIIYINK